VYHPAAIDESDTLRQESLTAVQSITNLDCLVSNEQKYKGNVRSTFMIVFPLRVSDNSATCQRERKYGEWFVVRRGKLQLMDDKIMFCRGVFRGRKI